MEYEFNLHTVFILYIWVQPYNLYILIGFKSLLELDFTVVPCLFLREQL